MRKKSKLYREIIDAAKIADESIVFFWERVLDTEEKMQELLRRNDKKAFKNAEKERETLINRIDWEDSQLRALEKKLKELE